MESLSTDIAYVDEEMINKYNADTTKFKLTEDLDDKFRNFKIDVHYDKLPITYYGETHDYSYYEPPDTDEYEDDVEDALEEGGLIP